MPNIVCEYPEKMSFFFFYYKNMLSINIHIVMLRIFYTQCFLIGCRHGLAESTT